MSFNQCILKKFHFSSSCSVWITNCNFDLQQLEERTMKEYNLKKLELDNLISYDFISFLKYIKNIDNLFLYHLDNEKVKQLLESLKNKNIQNMKLINIKINDCSIITDLLKGNPNVSKLKLCDNYEKGFDDFSNYLKGNSTLKSLSFRSERMKLIKDLPYIYGEIEKLMIKGLDMKIEKFQQFMNILKENKKLKTLAIDTCMES